MSAVPSLDPWLLALLLVHVGATIFMTGLIWFVQVVHYPLMDGVGAERWIRYERRHQARTTLVVAPAMLLELACAVLLVALCSGFLSPSRAAASLAARLAPLAWLGLALLTVVWLSTCLWQVPLHRRLSGGFDPQRHRRLVAGNWVRTVGWSGRAIVALAMLWIAVRP